MANNRNTVVQLLSTIGVNRGGLTKAVFDRLTYLSRDFNIEVVVTNHQIDFEVVLHELRRRGSLPEYVEVINPFADFATRNRATSPPLSPTLSNFPSNCIQIQESETVTRYYVDGRFIGLTKQSPDGALMYVDKHSDANPSVIEHRDVYSNGRLVKRDFLNSDWAVSYSIYVDENLAPFKACWVSSSGEYRCNFFADDENYMMSNDEFVTKWLKDRYKLDSPAFAVSDEPYTIRQLPVIPTTNRLAFIHTTHRDHSTGEFKGWWKHYRAARSPETKFVVMSESQRLEIEADLPVSSLATMVSFPTAQVIDPLAAEGDDAEDICYLGRLGREKRVDHIIRMFSNISSTFTSLKLHIYGTGPEEKALKELVKSLDLDERVVFHGYVSNSRAWFKRHLLSLVTSEFEGFCLAIAESLSVGCPVVAYDVDFGPREQIISGVNGELVTSGDERQLASVVTSLLRDRAALVAMRSETANSISRFSMDQWEQSLDSVFSEQ